MIVFRRSTSESKTRSDSFPVWFNWDFHYLPGLTWIQIKICVDNIVIDHSLKILNDHFKMNILAAFWYSETVCWLHQNFKFMSADENGLHIFSFFSKMNFSSAEFPIFVQSGLHNFSNCTVKISFDCDLWFV